MAVGIKRREFIAGLSGPAGTWMLTARAPIVVIACIFGSSESWEP